jgi:ferredoxin--NADP+ reductase
VGVDLFDRLPTPYGLVRGGVAPDHQHTKAVIKQFARIAGLPGFRFIGNVTFGTDLSLAEALAHYHQVLLATGSESDRRLGVPGEELPGSHPATAFVGWYNGHPDYREERFDLQTAQVVVIGHGNVAVDVARILTRSVDELARTDIADHAVRALRHSTVNEVHMLGRRGPAQAAFSHPELRELATLAGTHLVVRPEDLEAEQALLERDPGAHPHRNLDLLVAQSVKGEGVEPRRIRLRFFASPVEILGTRRVEGVRVERTCLVEDGRGGCTAVGTGAFEDIPCGLVFRAVGYRGQRLPDLPFDDRHGSIPHREGRVIDPQTGTPIPRVYVAGWIKRGPSGVIGTNRTDAVATVQAMLADADAHATSPRPADGADDLLARKGIQTVTFEGWTRIDAHEIARGLPLGKPRDKFTTRAELLAAALK